ncbi:MAG: hypothetical protein H7Y04_00150, partial [Verrucomicrobia bacterium]|nr:hypothetical protein [Cytophagales bacterium]
EDIDYDDLTQYNLEFLSKLYAQNKNFEKAYTFHQKFTNLKDSVYNLQTSLQLNTLKTRFETQKKEQAIKTLSNENKINSLTVSRLYLFSFSLVVLLASLGVIVYLLNSRRKIQQATRLQAERERISLELHDNVGSHLTYLVSSLDFLSHRFGKQVAGLEIKIASISDSTRDTIQQLRNTIWVLNQEKINIQALTQRLQNYLVQRFENIQVVFENHLPEVTQHMLLNANTSLQLFRIAQEALQNIEKHAQATKIEVLLNQVSESQIHLQIQDDGKGFVEEIKEGHFGLENMKKRAASLQGKLLIDTQIGKGTRISFTFPIQNT